MSSVPPQVGPGGQPRYPQQLERDRPVGPTMGYGGPPPPPGSYGNSYSSYPPPPYGGSMHGSYGPGAIPGQPPSGYPRNGYSIPPHSSTYGPGYGPGPGPGSFPPSVPHPPYYGGGYDSHYGGQLSLGHQSHLQGPQSSYRGQSPVPPQPSANGVLRGPSTTLPTVPSSSDQHTLGPGGSALLSKKTRSPPSGNKLALGMTPSSSGKNNSSQQTSETTQPQQALPDHGEVERLRAAAATEITTEEVKPIQTDFHFFAKEHMEKYRKLAEEEVRSSMEDKSEELDPLLVYTNLNTRLMKAWEFQKKETRESYMVKEEDDRRRFMEDDEIASRHCATLTARGKSPRVVGNDNSKDGAQQQKIKKESEQQDSASSKNKSGDKKTEETVKEEPKRSAPDSSGETGDTNNTQVSPSKKNKVG